MNLVLVNYDFENQWVDFATDENGHISLGGGLETPVLHSLFSNQHAPSSEGKLDQPYGWWGDNFAENDGDEYGSHVWLVYRTGKLGAQTLRRLQIAVQKSLDWMKEDGLIKKYEVTVEQRNFDMAAVRVRLEAPEGDPYDKVWEVHKDAI